ncbi:hypothetical protein BG004_004664 [Podila humilis]|nr:hypothetical protein BG004_004664 [Podila humilis]
MQADTAASPLRRRVKYGILVAVGILGSAHLLVYFGWSTLLTQSILDPVNDNLISAHPPDAIESDRGCMLLDRAIPAIAKPDFSRMSLQRWTECRPLRSVDGWSIDHCTTAGEDLGQDNGNTTTRGESPSCHPGGYFKIRRLVQPTLDHQQDPAKVTATCQLAPNTQLSQDPATNQYASSFLGPDTFRIVLLGPERLSLMQQQSLGNCTYAIPYMISRPGQFWVQKILHVYQNYDALDEIVPGEWNPKYVGVNILDASSSDQQGDPYYRFHVCGHCIPIVAADDAVELPACPKAANMLAKQYGIYMAKTTIHSVRDAVGHPYEWVPARPRCRLMPSQESFEAVDKDEDSPELQSAKAKSEQCLETTRTIYFVGDSHVRQLFSGVMQRLQGRPGPIDRPIQDTDMYTILAGNIEARLDFDPELKTLAALVRYSLGSIDHGEDGDKDVEALDDPALLEHFDTVVVGFGYEAGRSRWTTTQFLERSKTILTGLQKIHEERQLASGGDAKGRRHKLKVIWMGLPAWTDKPATGTGATKNDPVGFRTNPRFLYWDKMVEQMIVGINREVGGEGIVDKLSGFEITMPFKSSAEDGIHYTQDIPINGLAAELIHKLDLC